jgi:hypothetical protein
MRFTDEQARGFFDFINSMEEARYGGGAGQSAHPPLVFALAADSSTPVGMLDMEGRPSGEPQEAITMMLEHFEAAAYVREAVVFATGLGIPCAKDLPAHDCLAIALHRKGEPVAAWAREIVTDREGRRWLGDVLLNTLASPPRALVA